MTVAWMLDRVRAIVAELERLQTENERLRADFARFYDEVEKSQKFDSTGGDSAVAITLYGWSQRRTAPESETDVPG